MAAIESTENVLDPAAIVFAGAGEMRGRCREFDWSATSLGHVARWPQSRRTAASLVLANGFPCAFHAGEQATLLYNDAWAALIGTRHPAALGGSSIAAFAGNHAAFEPELRRALTGETIGPVEITLPATAGAGNDGSPGARWFTMSYSPLRDERGEVGGVLVTAIETTAARHSATALREGETRLRLAIDVARLGTWEWELATGIGAIDARGGEIVGLPPGVIHDVFRAQLQLIHPDDLEQLQATIVSAIERGGTFDLNYRVRYPDGTIHHVASQARVITDDAGRPAKLVGTNRDVTAERVASAEREQLLAQSEAERAAGDLARRRLETVLEHLPVGVSLAEAPSGKLLVSNAAVRRIWGTDAAADVAGQGAIYTGSRPGTGQRYESNDWPLARTLATGEVITDEVIEVERPDGVRCMVSVSAAPVRDADGAIAGGIVMSIDVTERERLLAETQAARSAAEQANRAKSDFLAVMSHELRTPLNAIGGYAELMEMGIRGPVTAQQRDDLRRIQSSQRHLLGLINEVLNYTKLETGTVHYAMTDILLSDAIGEAEGLMMPQARARGLTLSVAPIPESLVVHADSEKLRQVLLNLLSNSVKFTDNGGMVDVTCADAGSLVYVQVRDTGIGIPDDKLDVIFEPFVQVRSDLTRTAEGTGLGLAISRDLARGMGGDLSVTSALREGSTFTLTLRVGGRVA